VALLLYSTQEQLAFMHFTHQTCAFWRTTDCV